MPIERVGYPEPIQPGRGSGRVSQAEKQTVTGDSVSISSEGRAQADVLRALDIVKEAPDVRADRVAELKQKINNPDYINDVIVNGTADKILQALGI